MNVLIWVLQILLAAAFFGAGGLKLVKPKEALREQMGWVEDFSQNTIRAIAVAEILGALGLLLPGIVGIAGVLTPLAALGLGLDMVGAAVTHLRRHEVVPNVVVNVVLLVLAAVVTWARFGPYAF